ncbi:hypothetical protein ACN38_g173 [Penicillium nordicum]|uniref:Uncharacterized protein n=1 Tax=Penicillium nordicum TaxID=229535 RepID=A0A0M8PJJ9_9EURO|nr:hypothetical protein ACN38_g173 [Penicillium nordicum]
MAPLVTYHTTLRLIESARLTPTEHPIWSFSGQSQQALNELKIDWKRLVTKLARRDSVSSHESLTNP